MLTIREVYDGQKIEPSEEIPFREKRNVIITFLEERSANARASSALRVA